MNVNLPSGSPEVLNLASENIDHGHSTSLFPTYSHAAVQTFRFKIIVQVK
jgi:hypothetical protein